MPEVTLRAALTVTALCTSIPPLNVVKLVMVKVEENVTVLVARKVPEKIAVVLVMDCRALAC